MMTYFNTRSRMLLVVGMVSVGVALVASVLYLYDKADSSRLVQIEARRVESHAQEISSIEWQATAEHGIRSDLLSEFKDARRELDESSSFIANEEPDDQSHQLFRRDCDRYVNVVDRELELVRAGKFEQAEALDDVESDPLFDKLRIEIDLLNNEHSQRAESIARATRIGLTVIVFLAVGAMLFFLHRLETQRRKTDLALTEQLVLRRSEERFRTLTDNAADIVVVTDAQGVVAYVSPSVRKTLGLNESDLEGKSHAERIHPDDIAHFTAAFTAVTQGHIEPTIEFRFRHANGTWLVFECVIRNLLDDPNVNGVLLNVRDITLRKKAQDQLAFDAGHDALTKLPNRAFFMDRLQAAINRCKDHPERANALLFIDVDDFKVVNDCLGHDAGDLLIRTVADRLSNSLRREDVVARPGEGDSQTVARLGGDEFTILLEDLTDPSDAIRVAQRIQETLARPFLLEGQEVFKGASIGIAFASGNASAKDLMSNADIAMYRAKNNGKARCEIFDAALHAQVTRRLDLETALRRAVDNGEFTLFYQPIVSLASERVVGFEALVRWSRPGVGMVFPDGFVALAEATGLIVPIGKWALQEACREAATWSHFPGNQPLYVSVNVSGRQFSYPGFIEHVEEALFASQINPALLTLEITETTAMVDAVRAEEMMCELGAIGVNLSMDDFGTGYSSLSSLRRFPLSTLKIDRSFVSTMHQNHQSLAIVNTIIALARNLEMGVVAEGIETIEQLETLRPICDSGQGFYFSTPMPANAIPAFLQSRNGGRAARAAAASGSGKP